MTKTLNVYNLETIGDKSVKNIGIYNKRTGQKSCKIEMTKTLNVYNLKTIGDK